MGKDTNPTFSIAVSVYIILRRNLKQIRTSNIWWAPSISISYNRYIYY